MPVLDHRPAYAGPLAGFLTGLEHCVTPYLLTVPCDCPLYPLDLLERLAQALEQHGAEIAMAAAPEGGAGLRFRHGHRTSDRADQGRRRRFKC